MMPPSATAMLGFKPLPAYPVATITTEMKAKEEPTKLGTLPPVTAKKIRVPTPVISTQTLGSKPSRIGHSTLAPNMATTCCRPRAVVCGQGRRSSGATTVPSAAGFSLQNMLLEELQVLAHEVAADIL